MDLHNYELFTFSLYLYNYNHAIESCFILLHPYLKSRVAIDIGSCFESADFFISQTMRYTYKVQTNNSKSRVSHFVQNIRPIQNSEENKKKKHKWLFLDQYLLLKQKNKEITFVSLIVDVNIAVNCFFLSWFPPQLCICDKVFLPDKYCAALYL